jgi:hypothetical protein
MRPHLILIATAATLFFGFAKPAKAACIAGWGDTCPISDSDAAAQIRARVDGQLEGLFRMPRYVVWTVAQGSDLAAKMQVMQQVADILNSEGDCTQIDKLVSIAGFSWQHNCALAKVVKRRGLVRTIIVSNAQIASNVTKVVVLITYQGTTAAVKDNFIKTATDADPDSMVFYTHTLKFSQIVRTITGSFRGAQISEVQFEYELVPNAWAHVEKLMENDGLPSIRKTGSANFQKWSDGWHLVQ